MKKKTKKYLLYGIGITAFVLVLLAVGYFMSQQTVLGISKYGLTTDFTALLGIKTPYTQVYTTCNAETTNQKETLCLMNNVITETYGYGIFKGSAKLQPSVQSNIVRSMEALNKEVKKPDEYKRFSKEQKKIWDKTFGKGVFTKTLINKVKTNRYTYYDMKIVTTELDTSLNNWCTALNEVIVSGKFKQFFNTDTGGEEIDQWIQICNEKPKKIFSVSNDKIVLHLNDINLYDYKKYDTVCETPTTGCEGTCSVTMCHIVELPQTEKILIGTLQLSKLNMEIRPLGSNDFIIAVNDGIQQSSTITTQKTFANYITQMPTANAIDITTDNNWPNEQGYIIVTTNNQISKLVKDFKDLR